MSYRLGHIPIAEASEAAPPQVTDSSSPIDDLPHGMSDLDRAVNADLVVSNGSMDATELASLVSPEDTVAVNAAKQRGLLGRSAIAFVSWMACPLSDSPSNFSSLIFTSRNSER